MVLPRVRSLVPISVAQQNAIGTVRADRHIQKGTQALSAAAGKATRTAGALTASQRRDHAALVAALRRDGLLDGSGADEVEAVIEVARAFVSGRMPFREWQELRRNLTARRDAQYPEPPARHRHGWGGGTVDGW